MQLVHLVCQILLDKIWKQMLIAWIPFGKSNLAAKLGENLNSLPLCVLLCRHLLVENNLFAVHTVCTAKTRLKERIISLLIQELIFFLDFSESLGIWRRASPHGESLYFMNSIAYIVGTYATQGSSPSCRSLG